MGVEKVEPKLESIFQFNDIILEIPPTQISIQQEDTYWSWKTLRSKVATKSPTSHGVLNINVNMVFVPDQLITLHRMITEIKNSSFCYIHNNYLRQNICPDWPISLNMAFVVTSIDVVSVEDHPGTFQVQLALKWFNYFPYTPNFVFRREWATHPIYNSEKYYTQYTIPTIIGPNIQEGPTPIISKMRGETRLRETYEAVKESIRSGKRKVDLTTMLVLQAGSNVTFNKPTGMEKSEKALPESSNIYKRYINVLQQKALYAHFGIDVYKLFEEDIIEKFYGRHIYKAFTSGVRDLNSKNSAQDNKIDAPNKVYGWHESALPEEIKGYVIVNMMNTMHDTALYFNEYITVEKNADIIDVELELETNITAPFREYYQKSLSAEEIESVPNLENAEFKNMELEKYYQNIKEKEKETKQADAKDKKLPSADTSKGLSTPTERHEDYIFYPLFTKIAQYTPGGGTYAPTAKERKVYGQVTSGFGWRLRTWDSPPKWQFHKGVDFGMRGDGENKQNFCINAPMDGIITDVKEDNGSGKGSGRMITIKHDDNITTRYMHLDSGLDARERVYRDPDTGIYRAPKKGDTVKRGEPFAIVGNTGGSTAIHLHFEVLVKGKKVDPMPFVLGTKTELASIKSEGEEDKVYEKNDKLVSESMEKAIIEATILQEDSEFRLIPLGINYTMIGNRGDSSWMFITDRYFDKLKSTEPRANVPLVTISSYTEPSEESLIFDNNVKSYSYTDFRDSTQLYDEFQVERNRISNDFIALKNLAINRYTHHSGDTLVESFSFAELWNYDYGKDAFSEKILCVDTLKFFFKATERSNSSSVEKNKLSPYKSVFLLEEKELIEKHFQIDKANFELFKSYSSAQKAKKAESANHAMLKTFCNREIERKTYEIPLDEIFITVTIKDEEVKYDLQLSQDIINKIKNEGFESLENIGGLESIRLSQENIIQMAYGGHLGSLFLEPGYYETGLSFRSNSDWNSIANEAWENAFNNEMLDSQKYRDYTDAVNELGHKFISVSEVDEDLNPLFEEEGEVVNYVNESEEVVDLLPEAELIKANISNYKIKNFYILENFSSIFDAYPEYELYFSRIAERHNTYNEVNPKSADEMHQEMQNLLLEFGGKENKEFLANVMSNLIIPEIVNEINLLINMESMKTDGKILKKEPEKDENGNLKIKIEDLYFHEVVNRVKRIDLLLKAVDSYLYLAATFYPDYNSYYVQDYPGQTYINESYNSDLINYPNLPVGSIHLDPLLHQSYTGRGILYFADSFAEIARKHIESTFNNALGIQPQYPYMSTTNNAFSASRLMRGVSRGFIETFKKFIIEGKMIQYLNEATNYIFWSTEKTLYENRSLEFKVENLISKEIKETEKFVNSNLKEEVNQNIFDGLVFATYFLSAKSEKLRLLEKAYSKKEKEFTIGVIEDENFFDSILNSDQFNAYNSAKSKTIEDQTTKTLELEESIVEIEKLYSSFSSYGRVEPYIFKKCFSIFRNKKAKEFRLITNLERDDLIFEINENNKDYIYSAYLAGQYDDNFKISETEIFFDFILPTPIMKAIDLIREGEEESSTKEKVNAGVEDNNFSLKALNPDKLTQEQINSIEAYGELLKDLMTAGYIPYMDKAGVSNVMQKFSVVNYGNPNYHNVLDFQQYMKYLRRDHDNDYAIFVQRLVEELTGFNIRTVNERENLIYFKDLVLTKVSGSFRHIVSTLPLEGHTYPTAQHLGSIEPTYALEFVRMPNLSNPYEMSDSATLLSRNLKVLQKNAKDYRIIPNSHAMSLDSFITRLFGSFGVGDYINDENNPFRTKLLKRIISKRSFSQTVPGSPGLSVFNLELEETNPYTLDSVSKFNPESLGNINYSEESSRDRIEEALKKLYNRKMTKQGAALLFLQKLAKEREGEEAIEYLNSQGYQGDSLTKQNLKIASIPYTPKPELDYSYKKELDRIRKEIKEAGDNVYEKVFDPLTIKAYLDENNESVFINLKDGLIERMVETDRLFYIGPNSKNELVEVEIKGVITYGKVRGESNKFSESVNRVKGEKTSERNLGVGNVEIVELRKVLQKTPTANKDPMGALSKENEYLASIIGEAFNTTIESDRELMDLMAEHFKSYAKEDESDISMIASGPEYIESRGGTLDQKRVTRLSLDVTQFYNSIPAVNIEGGELTGESKVFDIEKYRKVLIDTMREVRLNMIEEECGGIPKEEIYKNLYNLNSLDNGIIDPYRWKSFFYYSYETMKRGLNGYFSNIAATDSLAVRTRDLIQSINYVLGYDGIDLDAYFSSLYLPGVFDSLSGLTEKEKEEYQKKYQNICRGDFSLGDVFGTKDLYITDPYGMALYDEDKVYIDGYLSNFSESGGLMSALSEVGDVLTEDISLIANITDVFTRNDGDGWVDTAVNTAVRGLKAITLDGIYKRRNKLVSWKYACEAIVKSYTLMLKEDYLYESFVEEILPNLTPYLTSPEDSVFSKNALIDKDLRASYKIFKKLFSPRAVFSTSASAYASYSDSRIEGQSRDELGIGNTIIDNIGNRAYENVAGVTGGVASGATLLGGGAYAGSATLGLVSGELAAAGSAGLASLGSSALGFASLAGGLQAAQVLAAAGVGYGVGDTIYRSLADDKWADNAVIEANSVKDKASISSGVDSFLFGEESRILFDEQNVFKGSIGRNDVRIDPRSVKTLDVSEYTDLENERKKLQVYFDTLTELGKTILKNPVMAEILGVAQFSDSEVFMDVERSEGIECYPDMELPDHPYYSSGGSFGTGPDFYMWNLYEDGSAEIVGEELQAIQKSAEISVANSYNHLRRMQSGGIVSKTNRGLYKTPGDNPNLEEEAMKSVLAANPDGSPVIVNTSKVEYNEELGAYIGFQEYDVNSSLSELVNTQGLSEEEIAALEERFNEIKAMEAGKNFMLPIQLDNFDLTTLDVRNKVDLEKYLELYGKVSNLENMFGARTGYSGTEIVDADDKGNIENTSYEKEIESDDNLTVYEKEKKGFLSKSEYESVFNFDSINKLCQDSAVDILSHSRSMKKAYPTFKMFFIEEDEQETRYRNLDDFYSYNGVKELTVNRDRETGIDTAIIILQNVSGTLDGTKRNGITDLDYFDKETTKGITGVETERYNSQTDPRLDQPFSQFVLRPGTNMQLRMGHSNDPNELEVMISGCITDISWSKPGDLCEIVVQSFGTELYQQIKGSSQSAEKKISYPATHHLLSSMILSSEVKHFGRWEFDKTYQYGESKESKLDVHKYKRNTSYLGINFNWAENLSDFFVDNMFMMSGIIIAAVGIRFFGAGALTRGGQIFSKSSTLADDVILGGAQGADDVLAAADNAVDAATQTQNVILREGQIIENITSGATTGNQVIKITNESGALGSFGKAVLNNIKGFMGIIMPQSLTAGTPSMFARFAAGNLGLAKWAAGKIGDGGKVRNATKGILEWISKQGSNVQNLGYGDDVINGVRELIGLSFKSSDDVGVFIGKAETVVNAMITNSGRNAEKTKAVIDGAKAAMEGFKAGTNTFDDVIAARSAIFQEINAIQTTQRVNAFLNGGLTNWRNAIGFVDSTKAIGGSAWAAISGTLFGSILSGYTTLAIMGTVAENVPVRMYNAVTESSTHYKNEFMRIKASLLLEPQDDNIFPPNPLTYIKLEENEAGDGFFSNLFSELMSIFELIDIGLISIAIKEFRDQMNARKQKYEDKRVSLEEAVYTPNNSTIWDIFREMTYRHPGWIHAAVPYGKEFRYTKFFGVPSQRYWSKPASDSFVYRSNRLREFLAQDISSFSLAAIKSHWIRLYGEKDWNESYRYVEYFNNNLIVGVMDKGRREHADFRNGIERTNEEYLLYSPTDTFEFDLTQNPRQFTAENIEYDTSPAGFIFEPNYGDGGGYYPGSSMSSNPYGSANIVGASSSEEKVLMSHQITNESYEVNMGMTEIVEGYSSVEDLAIRLKSKVLQEYIDGLSSRFVPFRRYHIIDSDKNLIQNNIIISNKNVTNAVSIQFQPEDDEVDTLDMKASSLLEDFEINQASISEFTHNLKSKAMALRYGMGILIYGMKEMYKGSLAVLGNERMRPWDVCYLFDRKNDMFGPIEIKAVTHIFSHETGFITEIIPNAVVVGNEISSTPVIDGLKLFIAAVRDKELDNELRFGKIPDQINYEGPIFDGFNLQYTENLKNKFYREYNQQVNFESIWNDIPEEDKEALRQLSNDKIFEYLTGASSAALRTIETLGWNGADDEREGINPLGHLMIGGLVAGGYSMAKGIGSFVNSNYPVESRGLFSKGLAQLDRLPGGKGKKVFIGAAAASIAGALFSNGSDVNSFTISEALLDGDLKYLASSPILFSKFMEQEAVAVIPLVKEGEPVVTGMSLRDPMSVWQNTLGVITNRLNDQLRGTSEYAKMSKKYKDKFYQRFDELNKDTISLVQKKFLVRDLLVEEGLDVDAVEVSRTDEFVKWFGDFHGYGDPEK